MATLARSTGFIPSTPAEVNPAWCTAAMQEAGVIGSAANAPKVTAVALEQLGGGTGMSGDTVRLRFTWDDGAVDPAMGALPATAIAKFAAPLPVIKGLLESLDAYAREIAFYQTLSASMPLRVPRFLGGAADPGRSAKANSRINKVVNGLPAKAQVAMSVDATKLLRPSKRRYALMIEDLGDALTVHDVVEPPEPEHLQLTLGELAKLHAAFWGRRELLDHGATARLVCPTPKLYESVYDGRVREQMLEVWSSWLTPEFVAIADDARRRFGADIDRINTPLTFLHGDPRSDNILFDDAHTSATFVDWALTGFGHPAYDVAYHLSASLDVHNMGHFVPLAQNYLRELTGAGIALDPSDFWETVRATMRSMLMQQIQAIPHPLSSYGDKNLEDYWAPRLFHALTETASMVGSPIAH